MKLERIVVGLDGSSNSARAADLAATLAQLTGAGIVAVHAVGLLEDLAGEGRTPNERRVEVRHQLESVWSKPLHRAGIEVCCEARDGHPCDVLLAMTDEVDADLLIVGRRGAGSFAERVLGSTSAQLSTAATCPLVIVPDQRSEAAT